MALDELTVASMVDAYLDEEVSSVPVADVAARYGVSVQTLYYHLRRLGLSQARRPRHDLDSLGLASAVDAWGSGVPVREVCARFGIAAGTLYRAIRAHGWEPETHLRIAEAEVGECAALREAGLTQREVARELDLSRTQVRRRLAHAGILHESRLDRRRRRHLSPLTTTLPTAEEAPMPVIPTTPVSVAVADPTDLARTVVVDPALLAMMRAAAAEAQAAPEDGALEQLSALVARHDELTAELAGLQARAEAAGAELRGIVTDRIPALMAAAGVTSFATASGRKVEVGPSYSATLAKGRDESEAAYGDRFVRALAWLRERGHDGIVRDEVVVTLGRGARELAERVVAAVTALGAECRREETVHSSTLKAFVRERFEAPHGSEPPFPAELFRASAQRVATVKAVKR